MVSQTPIKRCFIILCCAAAGILATGVGRQPWTAPPLSSEDLYQPSGTLGVAFHLEHLPTSLVVGGRYIVIDLSDRQLNLYQENERLARYPVAIGQNEWETPIGEFWVQEMRKNPVWRHPLTQADIPSGPENPLGSRWIGFLTEGEYHIGLHGTNQEDLIGQAVSHGCVRLRDQDIQSLYHQISLGTPIIVKP